MSGPKRIQRKRSKGWRKPDNTVCVTRPGMWGNPLRFKDRSQQEAERVVCGYRRLLEKALRGKLAVTDEVSARIHEQARRLDELRGKNLACFCPEGSPCHANVLLDLANR